MTEETLPHRIQLGAISYEVVIAVQSVSVGVEMISKRPDVPQDMREPLAILVNLAARAVEAAIVLQEELFAAFGLTPVSQEAANDEASE
jgi:hypothetical protein